MSPEMPRVDASVTLSSLLDRRLSLAQPSRGHRAGTDALLLAAAGPTDFNGRCLDVGAGTGAAGLVYAMLEPAARLGLVEIDPLLAALARRNIAANGLADRAEVIEGDVLGAALPNGLEPGSATLVLTNPPYLDPDRSRASSDPQRRLAHVMPAGGLARWLGAAALALAPGGTLVLIHRADHLGRVLSALADDFGALQVLPVHPRAGASANRILVRGVKGARGPLTIRPGLLLHGPGTGFTATVDAIHRGRARIAWSI
jgi:tRNA1(Val) A37 N6-methylase TrmN6